MSATRRTDAPPRRPLTELMDRQPPFDLAAEIGVLGSIVLLPDVLDDIVMILRPEGLLPERRRQIELTEGIGAEETSYEVRV